MKILHLLCQRPDATGSGIYVQAMIRKATQDKHENFLIAGRQVGQSINLDDIAPKQCLWVDFGSSQLPYDIVGMSDVMPYRSTTFASLSAAEMESYEAAFTEQVVKAVQEFKPDIIHSHHLWILTSLTRRLFPQIPLVTNCHGSDLRQFHNCPQWRSLVLSGCQKIDRIMTLSQAQKDEVAQLYAFPEAKLMVTGAGFRDTIFTSGPKPKPDPVQLVYAGKLSFAKGVPWLLRAMATIKSQDWQLHLVGSGSGIENECCLQLADELGKRVIIHGAVLQTELAHIFKQSHVFILPSFYEGLSLVLLEALASGCRIITTNLPGAMEIIGSRQSEFISVIPTPRLRNSDQPYKEDEKQFEANLAKACKKQISEAQKKPDISLASLKEVISAFTWDGVYKKIAQVYASFSPKK